MAQAETKSTQSNWLSIVKDVFPRWRDRLGSTKDAIAELEGLLRDPDTRSAKWRVDTSGEEGIVSPLDRGFWQTVARLLPVQDADGGDDRLDVEYTDPTDVYLPEGHWEYAVRRTDVERWERLYPMVAALPPTHGRSAEAEPLRKRGPKERIQWDRIKIKMMRLMDHHGDFDPADSEWNAQARLEEALKQYCQEQFSEEPSDGALRQKLPDWLDEWRSRKSQGISTSS